MGEGLLVKQAEYVQIVRVISRLLFAVCVCGFIVPAAGFASPDPRISIRQQGGEIHLYWPATETNWVLEVSAALPPVVPWVCVMPENYQTDGVSRFVRVAAATEQRFYRLRRLTPSVPGLTGHWQLDEGSGQMAGDEGGAGAVLFTAGTAWGNGRFGPGALRFNGASQQAGGSLAWVNNEGFRVLPAAGRPFSVSFWFNPEAMTIGWRGLAGMSGTNGWRVALHTPGTGTNYLVFAGVGTGGGLSVTGRALLLPGQWRQLTVTHDGAEGSLYLDGALLTRGAGPVPAQDGPLYFGGGVGGLDSFLGRLDDIRTYTNCLTPEQIALKGHWRFDEACGDFLADSSVNGRHGRVTEATAWAPGREGSGIDLSYGRVFIGNDHNAVLPPSGGSFSISFWLRPDGLPGGRSQLMNCGVVASSGWQLAVDVEQSGQARLHLESTNWAGTLDLRGPVPLSNGGWTKLELTYNGGIATVYADGRKLHSASGAVRGSQAPLVVGGAPGGPNFNGRIDELKVYGGERSEAEIGPVAAVMWETVLRNSATNFVLAGSGPPGKPLIYAVSPLVVPTNGTVSLAANSPVVTYTAGGRKGPDAFTYTVSDGEFTSPPTIFTVSVVEPHWLSPGGGSIEPKDGSSPAQAWLAGPAQALDAIWRTNNYYDCFFYGPGEFQTRGWKYPERLTANPGCKHVGAGAEGPGRTTIRLVDIWEARSEEFIFARDSVTLSDGFELHQMELNCNAENIPKYTRGEPIWIRIPLADAAFVNSVTLRWDSGSLLAPTWQMGRPAEFKLSAWRSGTNTFGANGPTLTSTGQVDVVSVGTVADEILLQLERRMTGVDFYALVEIEVPGASVSLPLATTVPGGGESRLDKTYAAHFVADGSTASSWASGPESQAQIVLPLPPGSAVNRLNLHWNCKTLTNSGRLGPAAAYTIRARDESTGQYYDVPFVRQPRTAAGRETAIFGTEESSVGLVTDRLVLLLTSREAGVDYYSLLEVTPQNGAAPVAVRQPTALNYLAWGDSYAILSAVDRDPATRWVSGTQGSVTAAALVGSNLKFTHLKIVGFGTKTARECFPLGVSVPLNPLSPPVGNVVVEDCTFSEPATHNKDGVTALLIGGQADHRLTNAVVRRCTISGLRPWFAYSQAVAASRVESCLVVDCSVGVYFEPTPGEIVGPVLVRSNLFQDVLRGVFIQTHPGAAFDSITCLNNEFVLTGGGSGIAVCDLCLGPPSGTVTNVTALNNIIRYPGWAPRPFSQDLGLLYSDIQHAVFGNNAIALGNPGALLVRHCPVGVTPGAIPVEDCDHPGPGQPGPSTPIPCLDTLQPGYRRAWFHNRDISGLLLPVRTYNNNVEVLASQQQWPE